MGQNRAEAYEPPLYHVAVDLDAGTLEGLDIIKHRIRRQGLCDGMPDRGQIISYCVAIAVSATDAALGINYGEQIEQTESESAEGGTTDSNSPDSIAQRACAHVSDTGRLGGVLCS